MKISIKKTVSVNKKRSVDPDSIYINILFYFNKPVFVGGQNLTIKFI